MNEAEVYSDMPISEIRHALMNGKGISSIHLEVIKNTEIDFGLSKINSPSEAAQLGLQLLFAADREQIIACTLNGSYEPISVELVHMGSVNETIQEAREIFKGAILAGATYIILYHNHPLGKAKPSQSDILNAKKLRLISEVIDIKLIDYILIGMDDDCFSMQEHGHMKISHEFLDKLMQEESKKGSEPS